MEQPPHHREVVAIDALRAVAASAIVLLHFRFDAVRFAGASAGPSSSTLESGVDLFFVISGFVMVLSSGALFGQSGAPTAFLIRRITRIVPIYWLTTAIYVAAAFVIPSYRATFDLPLIVASLLFIPWPRPDGIWQPVVGQGWTLQLEMFFYVLFATTLLLRRGMAVLVTTLLLTAAVAIGILWPLPPALGFFTHQIMLEFAAGMILGLVFVNGLRLPRWVAVALMIAGAALLVIDYLEILSANVPRVIRWGVPATLIVAGAAFSARAFDGATWRGLAFVGQASYALYLLHSLPNRAVIWAGKAVGIDFSAPLPMLALLVIALIGAVAFSVAVHLSVELPITRALRRWFKPHKRNAASPSPAE